MAEGPVQWWWPATQPRVFIGLLAGLAFVVIGVLVHPGVFFLAALSFWDTFAKWYAMVIGSNPRSFGELRPRRQRRYGQWQAAGQRLGLTFSEVSRRPVLSGFVRGVEVEVKVVIVSSGETSSAHTYYRAGHFDEEESSRLSEREANYLRMRLRASPTVKQLWEAYPDATVGATGISRMTPGRWESAEVIVDTVNDLVGHVKALRTELE